MLVDTPSKSQIRSKRRLLIVVVIHVVAVIVIMVIVVIGLVVFIVVAMVSIVLSPVLVSAAQHLESCASRWFALLSATA